MKKDYYDILHIQPPSSEEEIKQAYRNLAKQYHPDVNPEPWAHQKFLEISEAYEYLLEDLKNGRGRVYDQDEVGPEYFEEMRRAAKARAQERARMRFEKLQKEHEAFQESGLYDFVLLASYFGRFLLLVLCILFTVVPIWLIFDASGMAYPVRVLMFISGTVGLYFIFKARKKFFNPGKFYYTFQQIKKVFAYTNPDAAERCFFSPRYMGNSRPYKIEMIKIKDIKLQNYGPGHHGVAFDQKSVTLNIPRSRHALVVHSLVIVAKLASVLGCLFFLDISSVLWRIIIGFWTAGLLSTTILLVTRTKSTANFLMTTGLLIRCCIWFLIILSASYIQLFPFNIYTSDNMYGIAVFMVMFDSFLDQFLNFVSRKKFRVPWFRQHPLVKSHLEKKYQFGYDMPVLSVFYPIYKWILG